MYYVYSIIVGGLVGFALYTVLGSVRFKNNTVRLVVSVIFGISVFTMLTLQTEGFETIAAYDNGKVYRVGDKVTKDGQTYVMIDGIGAPGYPPPRPTNWAPVVAPRPAPVVAPRPVVVPRPVVAPTVAPRPVVAPTVAPTVAPPAPRMVIPSVIPSVVPTVAPTHIYANHTTCSQFGGSIDSNGLCSF